MKTIDEIKALIAAVQAKSSGNFAIDELALEQEYQQIAQQPTIGIRILSIIGGFMASILLFIFILISGLERSDIAQVVIGVILITATLMVSKNNKNTLLDTVLVSAYLLGFLLVILGWINFDFWEQAIHLIIIALAIVSLIVVQSYILSFLATLLIFGSILSYLSVHEHFELIHAYNTLLAALVTFIAFNEAKIIAFNKATSHLYSPIKSALIVVFVAGLFVVGKKDVFPLQTSTIWISSVASVPLIFYTIYRILPTLGINSHNTKTLFLLLSALALLPLLFSPAVAGAILILLTCFYSNSKGGFVLGIITLIYFIVQFYYDLSINLLFKSILMLVSGALFFALYWLVTKKLNVDENI